MEALRGFPGFTRTVKAYGVPEGPKRASQVLKGSNALSTLKTRKSVRLQLVASRAHTRADTRVGEGNPTNFIHSPLLQSFHKELLHESNTTLFWYSG